MLSDKRKKLIFVFCTAFLFLLTALLTKNEVTMAGNESSRFGTIQALAEQNTFALNHTTFRSADRIVIGDKIYSDKPLMLMVVHGMMFKVIAAVTGISFNSHYYLAVYLTNLFGIGLLNIILFILFFKRLDRDVEAPFYSKLFLSGSLLISTMLLSYGVTMNNHTPAALILFILFMQLMDYPVKDSMTRAFMIGVTAGVLLTVEIPVGGILGISSFLIVPLFSKERKLAKSAFYSAGGLLPIFVMCIINYIATGRIYPQYFGTGGTFQIALTDISGDYFLNILFWNRGFFSYMPAMLFIIPALLINRRILKNRLEGIVLLTAAAIILFYGLFTGEYGGWAYGFRYLIPIIPVIWFFIAREYAPKVHSWQYIALCGLIFCGIVTSYAGTYNPWCSCYEASRSLPNSVNYYVRNSFAANVLCISFEQNPDSELSRFMINRVYGPVIATAYLNEAFINTKNIEKLLQLREYCQKNPQTQMKVQAR